MNYTLDDHRTDPLRFPACMANHVWRQRGNTTGHCAKCHETYHGLALFDLHQRINDDGSVTCRDPREIVYGGQLLEQFDGGTWRGPRMTQDEISRAFRSSDVSVDPDGI